MSSPAKPGRRDGEHHGPDRERPSADPEPWSTSVPFETRLKDFVEHMGTLAPPGREPPAPSERVEPWEEPSTLVVPTEPPAQRRSSSPISPIAAPIEAHARRLQSAFARAGRRVVRRSDPEAIHDLRVTARRLVALLRVWRELFRGGSRRRAIRGLRNLRRRLGAVRELEAHTALLQSYVEHVTPVSREALEIAAHHSRRRLERERRRASKWAREVDSRALLALLARATGRIPEYLGRKPNAIENAQARVLRRERAGFEALRVARERLDDVSLHAARIAVKKWRYSSETLGAGLDAPDEGRLESLRELQETLGVIQDRASLRRELFPVDVILEIPESLKPVLEQLESERRAAVDRFQILASDMLGGFAGISRLG